MDVVLCCERSALVDGDDCLDCGVDGIFLLNDFS